MKINNQLKKVAVITGATKGIGKAIAEELTLKNFKVFSLSRSAGENKNIEYITCDITKKEEIENAFKQIIQKEKQIDLLINNAGMGISGAVETTKIEDLKYMFDVNFFGAVMCSQQVIPIMREQKHGKILFISSVGSILTIPFQTFYSATKQSINSLTEGLRMELKPFGIEVGAMMFGDIKSEFTANRKKNDDGEKFYGEKIKKAVSQMEKDEQNGMSTTTVAKVVVKTIEKKKLKPYRIVGGKYKLFCFLNRILPKRFVLFILNKLYG